MLKNISVGHFIQEDYAKYNCRKKVYYNRNGEVLFVDTMIANRSIFSDGGIVMSEDSILASRQRAYDRIADEYETLCKIDINLSAEDKTAEYLKRSKVRAKHAINDLILCDNFDCFVTLTFDKEKIQRHNYNEVIKHINTYLGHRVQRNGLRYLGVCEEHKKGGFHFHFLCNASSLKLVDSGCVSVQGKKKPIKISTADKYGIPLCDRHTVYNIADWQLGFSTAILTYGNLLSLSHYITKYITKAENKIGGRWYYSGGDLVKPVTSVSRDSYNDFNDFDYDYDFTYGKYKFKRDTVNC